MDTTAYTMYMIYKYSIKKYKIMPGEKVKMLALQYSDIKFIKYLVETCKKSYTYENIKNYFISLTFSLGSNRYRRRHSRDKPINNALNVIKLGESLDYLENKFPSIKKIYTDKTFENFIFKNKNSSDDLMYLMLTSEKIKISKDNIDEILSTYGLKTITYAYEYCIKNNIPASISYMYKLRARSSNPDFGLLLTKLNLPDKIEEYVGELFIIGYLNGITEEISDCIDNGIIKLNDKIITLLAMDFLIYPWNYKTFVKCLLKHQRISIKVIEFLKFILENKNTKLANNHFMSNKQIQNRNQLIYSLCDIFKNIENVNDVEHLYNIYGIDIDEYNLLETIKEFYFVSNNGRFKSGELNVESLNEQELDMYNKLKLEELSKNYKPNNKPDNLGIPNDLDDSDDSDDSDDFVDSDDSDDSVDSNYSDDSDDSDDSLSTDSTIDSDVYYKDIDIAELEEPDILEILNTQGIIKSKKTNKKNIKNIQLNKKENVIIID
jgi:hypothetical protein